MNIGTVLLGAAILSGVTTLAPAPADATAALLDPATTPHVDSATPVVYEIKDSLGNDYRMMIAPHPDTPGDKVMGEWECRKDWGWVFHLDSTGYAYVEGHFRGSKNPTSEASCPDNFNRSRITSDPKRSGPNKEWGIRLPWHIVERGTLSAGAQGSVFIFEAQGDATRIYLLDHRTDNATIGNQPHVISVENDGKPARDAEINSTNLSAESYYYQLRYGDELLPATDPVPINTTDLTLNREQFVHSVKCQAIAQSLRAWDTCVGTGSHKAPKPDQKTPDQKAPGKPHPKQSDHE